jgi:hypothetical protein
MKLAIWVIAVLCVLASALAQDTIKKEVESGIVWSGPQCQTSYTPLGGHDPLCDSIPGAHPEASSLVQDPLTGNSLRKISYEGVDVISGLRSYALGCGWNECHTAYVATFTIVNNTQYPLELNGRTFTSTLPQPTEKEIRKWWGKKARPSDFVPSSGTIPPGQSARVLGAMVGTGNMSNITRWWDHAPVFVVPLRYSIKIRGKDFVFPWLGPIQRDFEVVPQWNY